MKELVVQTMTLNEYMKFAILQEVIKMAEEDGVKIVSDKERWPRLVTKEGRLVMLRTEGET
jgi:predicted peroxiredoxin